MEGIQLTFDLQENTVTRVVMGRRMPSLQQ